MDLEDAGSRARFLIRDRGGNFPGPFDTVLTDAGIGDGALRRPDAAHETVGFTLHLFGSIRGALLLSWWRR